jgi:ribosome biogenesis protein Nip4
MPKGEKLRPKQLDQLPLENFENSRVRIFDLTKILLLQNLASCGGEFSIMTKGGIFGTCSIFQLEYLSLCLNKCVWIRDRKMNLICKNKPSGGKE